MKNRKKMLQSSKILYTQIFDFKQITFVMSQQLLKLH